MKKKTKFLLLKLSRRSSKTHWIYRHVLKLPDEANFLRIGFELSLLSVKLFWSFQKCYLDESE